MARSGSGADDLRTRSLVHDDAGRLSAAFGVIGWSKPADTFRTYVDEETRGARWTRVAEWQGEIAGYVTLEWDSRDPEFQRRGIPEIADLNVLPTFRNQGIGGALLEEAEDEASGRSDVVGIRVGLHSGYGAAQRVYARRGYVPDGSGVVVRGEVVSEGAEIRLDDEATLRMTKRLRGQGGAPRAAHS